MANVQTVLVVDDDELLARMISEFLVGKGFHVWTARDGLQGYSSYRRCQTEMVVTDIEMPHLDGFDMMRCIRTINPSVKTIYMSAAPCCPYAVSRSVDNGSPEIRRRYAQETVCRDGTIEHPAVG